MNSKSGVISLCPGSCAPWQIVKAFAASEGIEEGSLTLFSPPGTSPSLLSPGSASAALCCASPSGQTHNRDALAELAKLLQPGSRVYVHDASLVSAISILFCGGDPHEVSWNSPCSLTRSEDMLLHGVGHWLTDCPPFPRVSLFLLMDMTSTPIYPWPPHAGCHPAAGLTQGPPAQWFHRESG